MNTQTLMGRECDSYSLNVVWGHATRFKCHVIFTWLVEGEGVVTVTLEETNFYVAFARAMSFLIKAQLAYLAGQRLLPDLGDAQIAYPSE